MCLLTVGLSIHLMALTAGTALYLFCERSKHAEARFAKIIALVVIVLAVLASLGSLYDGLRHWYQGCCGGGSCWMSQSQSEVTSRDEDKLTFGKKMKTKNTGH